MKRAAVGILKLAAIAFLVWYLAASFPSIDFEKLEGIGGRFGWIALAQAFLLAVIACSVKRWQILLSAQGIRYRFWDALSLACIGYFFSQFVPGPTGGDVVKAYYVALDHPERRAAGVTAVFLDRVVGVFVLVLISAAAMAANWRFVRTDPVLIRLGVAVGAILILSLAGGALFFSARFRSWGAAKAVACLPFQTLLQKILAAIDTYRGRPFAITAVLLLSCAAHLLNVGVAISFAKALGGSMDVGGFFFIAPLASLAMAVPIGMPGGLGQMESAYQALLGRVGYGGGLLVALLIRLSWCLWSLPGIVFYLTRRRRVVPSTVEIEAAGGRCARTVMEPTASYGTIGT